MTSPQSSYSRRKSLDNTEEGYSAHEESTPGFFATWWVLIPGLALGWFAPQLMEMVPRENPWAMWFFAPYHFLVLRKEIGFSPEIATALSEALVYLQFPIDAVLFALNLRKRTNPFTCVMQIVFIHFIGAFVLWLLSQAH